MANNNNGLGLQIGGGLPSLNLSEEDKKKLQDAAKEQGIGGGTFGKPNDDPFGLFPNNPFPTTPITPSPKPSIGPSVEIKDGQLVEGDITTDSNIKLPSGTTGGDNSPHGGPVVIGGVGGSGGNGGTGGNLTYTDNNNNTDSSYTPSYPSSSDSYTPSDTTIPSQPESNDQPSTPAPEPEPEPPKPVGVIEKPNYEDYYVPMDKNEVKDTFTYQERKELGMDKNDTEVIKNYDGSYSVKTGLGDIYVITGEGEGRVVRKTADWRDHDGDGKVSFGEHLVSLPTKLIYRGQDLADKTYDLFDDPDDYWKDLKGRVKNNLDITGENINMSFGGADNFGLTKYGKVADLNGDGEVDAGERLSNTIDNAIAGYNDIGVNNLKKVLDFTLTSFGVSSEDAYRIVKGAETTLGFVNAGLQTVWNPIGGMLHLASAGADAAHDPKFSNVTNKQDNMEKALYGETVTNTTSGYGPSTPTTPSINATTDMPDEVEEVMNQLSAKIKKKMTIDSDKLVMEARERHKLEQAGNNKELSDIDEMDKLKVQDVKDIKERKATEEANIKSFEQDIKKYEDEDLKELEKYVKETEQALKDWEDGIDSSDNIKEVLDGTKFGLKGQVDKWTGKTEKKEKAKKEERKALEDAISAAKKQYEAAKTKLGTMKDELKTQKETFDNNYNI